MKYLPLLALLMAGCVAAGNSEPVVTRVTWTHPAQKDDRFYDAVNKNAVQVVSTGALSRVRTFGTVYYSDDLEKAQGWIAKEGNGFLLCFHAPAMPATDESEGVAVAAASAVAFDFEVRDLPAGAKLRFEERCKARPDAVSGSNAHK